MAWTNIYFVTINVIKGLCFLTKFGKRREFYGDLIQSQ